MDGKNILILSTWRSGSTLLADIITQYPGTYYAFEPLYYYEKKVSFINLSDRVFQKVKYQKGPCDFLITY